MEPDKQCNTTQTAVVKLLSVPIHHNFNWSFPINNCSDGTTHSTDFNYTSLGLTASFVEGSSPMAIPGRQASEIKAVLTNS